jgi:hypothetical protein
MPEDNSPYTPATQNTHKSEQPQPGVSQASMAFVTMYGYKLRRNEVAKQFCAGVQDKSNGFPVLAIPAWMFGFYCV